MYQMTHITAERGALTNDDRLDALAMAVQYWVDEMARLRASHAPYVSAQ